MPNNTCKQSFKEKRRNAVAYNMNLECIVTRDGLVPHPLAISKPKETHCNFPNNEYSR